MDSQPHLLIGICLIAIITIINILIERAYDYFIGEFHITQKYQTYFMIILVIFLGVMSICCYDISYSTGLTINKK